LQATHQRHKNQALQIPDPNQWELLAGFPCGIWSIESWNRFFRLWKSIEFGQDVYNVLKKYGNSKFNRLFIEIVFHCRCQFCRYFALCSM